jgi:hypothetical protein
MEHLPLESEPAIGSDVGAPVTIRPRLQSQPPTASPVGSSVTTTNDRKGTCMLSVLSRTCAALAVAAATAVVAVSAAAGATTSAAQIGAGPYVITPKTYWTTLRVTCPAGEELCEGMLSLETAYAIKPYPSLPKAKAKVADVAYSVPAGSTKSIRARVYGPALAQAIKTHSVTLRIIAWNKEPAQVAQRLAVFRLAHR